VTDVQGTDVQGTGVHEAWDALVSAALLGTQRRRLDPAVLPDAVRPLAVGAPEEALLAAAAVLANYRRAGQLPARPAARAPTTPRDERGLVPPAARRRLRRLPTDLLAEWLRAVHATGRRVPPEHLPALADAARTRAALRGPLAAVAGPAGAWLGAHNPAWAFLASPVPGATGVEAWHRGSTLQRREWLARTLAADPATARAALAATWASDPAGVRTDFLDVLAAHLAAEDEPFLEAALDDRGATVRETAAALLARLPGSRLAARMGERAGHLVRPVGDGLVVDLPDARDPALLRDAGGGPRSPGELLVAVVAATPLQHWAAHGTSEQVLARPVTGVDPRALRTGWTVAAGRQRDAAWGAAVLTALDPAAVDGTVVEMVAMLPERVHRPAVAVLAARVPRPTLVTAVAQLAGPWSAELGTGVLDWLAAHPGDRGLGAAARAAAVRVPRACLQHPVATGPLPIGYAPWWRELAATLTVRREMHEELA
jgi:hypothetical protein